jgi:hypothetical protein
VKLAAGVIAGLQKQAWQADYFKSAETPMLEATPHLLGPEGLWHTPDRHVPSKQKLPNCPGRASGLRRCARCMDESQAIATAINAVKRWAKGKLGWGKRKVTPEVQAAAKRTLKEWEKLKATHH